MEGSGSLGRGGGQPPPVLPLAGCCARLLCASLQQQHSHPNLSLSRLPQVEDDDTALRLAGELARGKCGRVSFMPLNRLNPQAVKYPEQVRRGAADGPPALRICD